MSFLLNYVARRDSIVKYFKENCKETIFTLEDFYHQDAEV